MPAASPDGARPPPIGVRLGGGTRTRPGARGAPLTVADTPGGSPTYAVEVVPGSFGSFAGLKTDACARVLDAAGAGMASIVGGHRPARGINLGPAMTSGHVAGRHAAGATGPEGARGSGAARPEGRNRPEVRA